MSSFPELHELIWLFEVEPDIEHEDLGWPISQATFRTARGEWRVECTIAPYDHTVDIRCWSQERPAVELGLRQNVQDVKIDRARGAESLMVACKPSALLHPIRLQLKPHVAVSLQTRLPWERP